MLGIGAEQSDEELAQQNFADPKSHVLTVWNWRKCLSRRDHLAAELLDYCENVRGDPELCREWCEFHGIRTVPPNLRYRFGKLETD